MRKLIFLTVLLTVLGSVSRSYADNPTGQAAGKRQHKPMKSTHQTVIAGQVDRRSKDKIKGGSLDSSNLEINKEKNGKGSSSNGGSKGSSKNGGSLDSSNLEKNKVKGGKGNSSSGNSTGNKTASDDWENTGGSTGSKGKDSGKGGGKSKGSISAKDDWENTGGSAGSNCKSSGKDGGKSKTATDDWQNTSGGKTAADDWNSTDAKSKTNGSSGFGGPTGGSIPAAAHQ